MRNYIILNGKNSNEINGLLIQELPPISKPLIRTEVEEIDGRDGDIVTPLGYSAYDKEFTIGLYKDFDVNEVAAYFNSEGTVIFSNEPDKYYYYQITAQIDFERLVRYRTATVTMHCQPFKYSATEQPITEDVSGTVSDEGTNLALENTAEAPFNTLDLKGNTSQQTYSGKNLLKYPYKDTTVTRNNVTFTVNSDGSIATSGTASAETLFWLTNDTWAYNTNNIVVPAGTYTINKTGKAYIAVYITAYGETQGQIGTYNASTSDTTFTVPEKSSLTVRLRVVSGANTGGFSYSPQLESGSSATALEPYTNGPAPNPDYPQAVQTVTGENVVKITGKNLAKMANGAYSYSAAGQTFTLLDGSITTTRTNGSYQGGSINISTGALGQWALVCASDSHLTGSGGTYTLTFSRTGDVVSSSSSRACIYGFIYDSNGNNTSGNGQLLVDLSTDTSGTYTLNLAADRHLGALVFYSQFISYSDVELKVQLEIGSSASSFEPYQEQSYEVNLGKNLFDKDNVVQGIPQASDGSIGQTTGAGRTCQFIPVMPNTRYTHSGHPQGWAVIAYYRADKSFISRVGDVTTITTPSDCFYASVSCAVDNLSTCQFELGSQATSYAAYFAPIELCNIPGTDYRDRFISRDGKWYVHKEIGKNILDGGENWWESGAQTDNVYQVATGGYAGVPVSAGYSDRLEIITTTAWYAERLPNKAVFTSNNIYVRVSLSLASTLEQFKAWLASNPTTLYYALATPTDTEITNEALIEQLDNIYYHAHAYKGRTHITSSAATGNVPHIIAAEVGEDNESTITNAGNYLSKPKITVYGSGDISLYINDMHVLQITLGDEGYITIDTAQMEAYKDTLDNLKNRLVIGDYSNARLKPGANKIHFTGTVTKYVVENYSRWL